jgi:hypothetical protein
LWSRIRHTYNRSAQFAIIQINYRNALLFWDLVKIR